MPPEVSVLVPTNSGGTGERLATAVRSVLRGRNQLDVEVVVVLNGADADTAQLAERLASGHPEVRVVASGADRGFGGGVALGAAHAEGRVFAVIHDDAVLHAGAVDALVAALDATPRLGAVTGPTVTFTGEGSHELHGAVVAANGHTRAVASAPAGAPAPVDYSGTALFAMRADAYQEAGGFDPGYFPAYFTDVDLAFRLRAAGWWVGYTPTAAADHHAGSSTESGFRAFVAERNRHRFLARWGHALEARAGVDVDDIDGLLRHAAADRDRAVAGDAPRPRPLPTDGSVLASPPDPLDEAWYVEQRAAIGRAYEGRILQR